MAAASMAATVAAAPGKRAFGVSRAMCPGAQRLCSTWSGDNHTSWASLRWGLRTGLQMALSGMYFMGHDVGGFAAPCPMPSCGAARARDARARAACASWLGQQLFLTAGVVVNSD
jgi:alpha-glucosidase (family GH31 glycosyl hydrolase)